MPNTDRIMKALKVDIKDISLLIWEKGKIVPINLKVILNWREKTLLGFGQRGKKYFRN